MEKIHRHILCIDLKSFFASVECVERHIDAFQTNLVVANPNQGNGAITLAVSPALKKLGISGRTRLYQIPRHIKYQIVPPQMSLYIKYSKEVVAIYLSFVSQEDLHIYSIDECFLDVTDYLNYYKLSDYELAEKILKTVEEKTGLTATCGIGPNMLLAKLAMDIEAKKYKNGIAKWDYEDVPNKLWPITPLSRVWGIGARMERRLNLLNMHTVGDIAKASSNMLKERFGVIGYELWLHANGIDNSLISSFQKEAKEKSFSHSQVLFRDYFNDEILLVIKEMIEVLCIRIREKKLETFLVHFSIHYSKTCGGGFSHSMKLDCGTDKETLLFTVCKNMFDNYYEENTPIRKVSIAFGKLAPKVGVQLNLFEQAQEIEMNEAISSTLDEVKRKFGKNSILKATSLLSNSTIKDRNQKIGGHHE